MERRALVAETVLASGELAEVLRGLGHDIVIELEDDATSRLVVDADIELGEARLATMTTGRENTALRLRCELRTGTYEYVRHGDEGNEERRGWRALSRLLDSYAQRGLPIRANKKQGGLSNRA